MKTEGRLVLLRRGGVSRQVAAGDFQLSSFGKLGSAA